MSFNIDYVAGSMPDTLAGPISGNGLHFLRQRPRRNEAAGHMQIHGAASSPGRRSLREYPKIGPEDHLLCTAIKAAAFTTLKSHLFSSFSLKISLLSYAFFT
ncbi:MAG: hypothetical protein PSV22_05575 [Pseudolabrys sp.]|nr:hypothetical protein [Pseudolabrys sp.]